MSQYLLSAFTAGNVLFGTIPLPCMASADRTGNIVFRTDKTVSRRILFVFGNYFNFF